MKKLLVTGSSGLIGSAVAEHFHGIGWGIVGVDNNSRADFFGPQGDTRWNQERLKKSLPRFRHVELDIRDRVGVANLIGSTRPDLIVHAAAQPSHDLAAKRPFDDFDVNAVGTLNMLEGTRQGSPESVFVYMSTNKVYGDSPNKIPRMELETRFEFESFRRKGVNENQAVDGCTHSVFGASKLAADMMVQEYGRYFGMQTCCLRGGCLTGPNHSGVELHGFLSYLIKCNVRRTRYTVFGYHGKQVRDNIHSYDVAEFIRQFYELPGKGSTFNLGGGYANSISILESFTKIEALSGRKMIGEYVDVPRVGDHIVYYSDLDLCQRYFPDWKVTRNLDSIFEEIYLAELSKENK